MTSLTNRLPLAKTSTRSRSRSPSAPRGCQSTSLQLLPLQPQHDSSPGPRGEGHTDVVDELHFPRSSRQLEVVDELRKVCRRTASQPRASDLEKDGGRLSFTSATSWLPRGRDCSTRINVPATPRKVEALRKSQLEEKAAGSVSRKMKPRKTRIGAEGGWIVEKEEAVRRSENLDVRKGPQV